MTEYVLVSDPSLSYDYRGFPLLDFLPCAPSNPFTQLFFPFLRGPALPHDNGRAIQAPYALRKIEAALLQDYNPEQVVVAHPDYVDQFIDENTKIIGVHTMDPVGLGPVTMMYTNGRSITSLVEREFVNQARWINRVRNLKAPRAKFVVGGPGSWELWYTRDILESLGIDYVVQGEMEDVVVELLDDLYQGSLSSNFMYGFQTFDENFSKTWEPDPTGKFVTRAPRTKQFPSLNEIPEIRGASMKGLVEVMRGCGIGCDFCEVTLRPTRYYPPEKVKKEILVNLRFGIKNAWLQSDEIFIYGHTKNFEPNEEALVELFSTVMSVPVGHTNPTHGRISIPAGYPGLIQKLSQIVGAGPNNWIGIQAGIESASDRLAQLHMPLKTMPLKIGPDGTFAEIIAEGTTNLNKYYWRPAFTLQIGQAGETAEDNWDTVGLINDMSRAGLEFTATVLYNVPLGLLKTRRTFNYNIYEKFDEAQMAVIYSSFRHLLKMTQRRAFFSGSADPFTKLAIGAVLHGGAAFVLYILERMFVKNGLDPEKVKRYSLNLFAS